MTTGLYALVAVIALVMALESLRARKFLRFHEAAAAQPWDELGPGVQAVILSLLFCAGLCAVNFQLHRRTGAATPWRGSLYAAIAIAAGLLISIIR